MNILEIENLVIRCMIKTGSKEEIAKATVKENVSLPLVALTVAANLWINAIQEDEDTKEFRHQLQHLNAHGYFDIRE